MRDRNLVCPHCHAHMARVRKPRNIYWACGKCGGRSSTIALMRQTMPAPFVNWIWQEIRQGLPERKRPCPSCTQRMCQIEVRDKGFIIDVCKTCTFVWFDPSEYGHMPRMAKPSKPLEQELPSKARQMLAMEDMRQRRIQAKQEKTCPDEYWKYVPALLGMPVEFDYGRPQNLPLATWIIAGSIVLISLIAFLDVSEVVLTLGLVPAEWNRMGGLTFLTSFFLHGDWVHLIGNVYFLLVFGDNVEEQLGAPWFVWLLIFAMFMGGVGHILTDPSSTIPCIGASGGVAALLTFYALQFPGQRIGFLFFFVRWVRLPVMAYVIFWLFLQFIGLAVLESNVAYGAHLGGAAAGILFWLVRKKVVKCAT